MNAQPIGILAAASSAARRNGSATVNRRLPDRSRDPVAWQMLSDIGVRRVLAPGAVLSTDAERGGVVVLVEDGAVKVVGVAENGNMAVLAVRSAGGLIGELAFVTPERHLTSVIGLLPATVVTVPATRLSAALQSRPTNALLLLNSVTARVHEADRRRVEYASYSVPERICRVLVDLADQFRFNGGLGGRTVIPLVQQDLAGLAGASREATAKVLRRLREAGAIRTQRSRIVILRTDLIVTGSYQ
jgi:CRP/FNR family transcriptional regulator, cyclic AMP receptor protein